MYLHTPCRFMYLIVGTSNKVGLVFRANSSGPVLIKFRLGLDSDLEVRSYFNSLILISTLSLLLAFSIISG